jgi:hypothetical protein
MTTYTSTLRLHDNIVSVKALPPNQFSLVKAYEYISKGVPPNKLNERDRLQTPDGVDLVDEAIFLEAEVDNTTNPPVFRQQVINGVFADNVIQVHEYETFIPFTYPGVIGTNKVDLARGGQFESSIGLNMTAPVQTEVKAKVFEFIQVSPTISDSDFNTDGATALWRPNQWASVKAEGLATFLSSFTRSGTFTTSQDFRGFRLESGFGDSTGPKDIVRYNGGTVMRQYSEGANLTVSAVNEGPPDPVGSKWVIDIDLQPIFSGADGTTYYKKSIIVSDTIRSQVDNTLPYN